jgi:hypothetical protein
MGQAGLQLHRPCLVQELQWVHIGSKQNELHRAGLLRRACALLPGHEGGAFLTAAPAFESTHGFGM